MIAKLNLNGLNPPQRAVVETTEGPVLVLAGAGTGKTRAVTVRIAYLLSKKKVSPKHILAVTFTNKAAGEMRERIQSLVGKKRAGDLTVCTFHSLCVQILRENYREAGLSRYFTIYDERDQQGLIRTAIHENQLSDRSLDPAVFLYRISDAKSNLITPKKFKDMRGDKYAEWSQLIYEAYQEMLQARSAVDFDDLIMKTILMFKAKPEVLKKYHERFRYIMVDEFQDTSTAQFTLVEQLARAHKNLCVVGDDDQSIYSWRGAQVSNILDFKKNFSKTKVVKLEQNYRSSGMILDAANAVIANNTQRHAKKLWTAADPGVKLQLLVGHDEYSEAEFVCQHLYGIHKNFRVPHKNIAILYRSNAQSRVFEEQLRKLKVPYRIVGGQSFYDRKEVRDVVAYLRLFYNPKDEISLLRIINVPRRGIGDTSVVKIVEAAREKNLPVMKMLDSPNLAALVGEGPASRLHQFRHLVQDYTKRFRQPGMSYTFEKLISDLGYEQDLKKSSKSEKDFIRRWENVMEVTNSLAGYAEEEKKPNLRGFLERVSLLTGEEKGDKKQPDEGVTLMTVHSAKGLEFPLVYLVGMEEDLFPHAKSLADGGEALHEERRLCYVALTRAQKHLVLSRAEKRRKFGKMKKRIPSRFLKEIPEDLIQPLTPRF